MPGRLLSLLAAVAALFLTAPARAEPFRILYAEQIDLPIATAGSRAVSKPLPAQQLALRAYGREYDLRLESHDSLAGRLPPAVREGKALYRGSLGGLAGSWVRLTVVSGEVFGAFWDGSDLYSIAPGRTLEPFLDSPLPDAASTGTFVYRLSDTQGGVADDFCGASPQAATRGAAITQYRALVGELKSIVANNAVPLQLEVALVGDPELAGRFTDPQGEMLSTVNIVDGIFTSQLDVSIIPTDVRVLAAAGNPLQSTDAPTLLDQLSDYRFATDAVRERGLAHLLTGKELDGNTAGIAFLGALCEPRAGVGLSEGWHGASIAALIMAHELGHNFGSPHDAQDGSPCVNTPAHFLMAPVVNFTSTFSACSREQMQPHIAAADCVVPLRIADVGIVAPAELQALIEEPFDIPIEVRAIGELTAENVHLRVVIGNVMPTGVTASGGTCSLAGAAVNCEFGALQPGEARQVTVRAVAGTPSGVAIIELTASNDRNHTNNNGRVEIDATSPADVRALDLPSSVTGRVGQPMDLSFGLQTGGPRASRNVTARIVVDNTQILTAEPDSGSCTIDGVVVTCTFGELPPGATRNIDVTVQPLRTTARFASIEVSADNDFTPANDHAFVELTTRAVSDLGLHMPSSFGEFVIGAPFEFVTVVRSTGLEASAPGTVTIALHTSSPTIDSIDAPGGTCTSDPETIVCSYGSLPGGAERTITVRAHGPAGFYEWLGQVESVADDNPENNLASFSASVRPAISVAIGPDTGGLLLPYADTLFHAVANVRSFGVMAPTDVAVRAEIPAQFTIVSAALEGGSCSVAAQLVTCNRATLPADGVARLVLMLIPVEAGTFQLEAIVSAPGDVGSVADNTVTWPVQVREGIDVAIEPPAPATILLGLPQTLTLFVRNGRLPAEFNLNMAAPPHVLVESAAVAGGNCSSQGPSSIGCFVSVMQPREVRRVDLVVRARFMAEFTVHAGVTPFGSDVNSDNNMASLLATVTDRQGDAGVQLSAATASGRVGQTFTAPAIVVTATAPVDDATISVTTDSTIASITGVLNEGVACSFGPGAQTLTCLLGTIEPGTPRRIEVNLQGQRAGSFTGSVTFSARNDTNFANNTTQLSVDVSAVPPPSPPPPTPPSSGGGGGGGGAIEPYWIALLLALVALRLTYRSTQLRRSRPRFRTRSD